MIQMIKMTTATIMMKMIYAIKNMITIMHTITKTIKMMISGRETQLRSPFYSPLNSMWQVRNKFNDDSENGIVDGEKGIMMTVRKES